MTLPPTDPSADNTAFIPQNAAYQQAAPTYGAQQPTYAAYGMPMAPGYPMSGMPAPNQSKGFFARLFDLSFKSYVTPSVVRFLFVFIAVVTAISWLVGTIITFTESVGVGFLYLIIGAAVWLLLIIIYRIGMEISVAIINIAENTARIR